MLWSELGEPKAALRAGPPPSAPTATLFTSPSLPKRSLHAGHKHAQTPRSSSKTGSGPQTMENEKASLEVSSVHGGCLQRLPSSSG